MFQILHNNCKALQAQEKQRLPALLRERMGLYTGTFTIGIPPSLVSKTRLSEGSKARAMAEVITSIEHRLLREISMSEFQKQMWSKVPSAAPNLRFNVFW